MLIYARIAVSHVGVKLLHVYVAPADVFVSACTYIHALLNTRCP